MKADGFSLVEVLVASALVIVGAVSLAQLFGTSTDRIRAARFASLAALLATQKLEQLRSETDVSPSPPDALRVDTPGYVDYVDARGMGTRGAWPSALPGTVFTRRWSVEPIAGSPSLVLQVLVTPGAVHFVTLKPRRAG
jgi:type II secretory pathway pseudopilin PulG